MDFNGYKRTKKFDIKRWFKGTNSIVYLVILVVMVLGLLFVLRTVISMHNSNKNADNVSQEETTGETDSSEMDTQTQTIAKNQSYYIRISIAKHTLVVYQLDDNKEFSIPVKAFKVALGPKVVPAKTAISEKSLWRKITDIYYVRYSSRLDNAEYLSTATYYSQSDNNLNPRSYNAIGQNVSEGSILMTCANAKWIYENCGAKTTVEIVDDFDISSDIKVEGISRIADDAYRDPTDNVNGSSNIQNNNVSQYNQTQADTEAVTNDDRPQETEAQTQKNDSGETQPTTVSQQETNAQHTQSSETQTPYDKTVSEYFNNIFIIIINPFLLFIKPNVCYNRYIRVFMKGKGIFYVKHYYFSSNYTLPRNGGMDRSNLF